MQLLHRWSFILVPKGTDHNITQILTKVVCVFQMVIVSLLTHAEFGPNDHREDAPNFMFFSLEFHFGIGLKLKYNLEEIKEGRMDELGWPPLFSFSTECILFWFQVFICGAHIPPWASGWPPEFQLFVFARIIQERIIN